MSRYCGKCDLWDSLVMIREVNDEITDWDKIKIYQINDDSTFDEDGWNNVELLNIKCLKDLLPYAAYIVSMSSGSNEKYIAYIGTQSYVQEMEQERIELIARNATKVYDRCKRQKKEYNVEDVAREITYSGWEVEDYVFEIVKRIKAHPYSFKLNDISVPICKYYKYNLYDDMIKMGYSQDEAYEWCYNNKKTW